MKAKAKHLSSYCASIYFHTNINVLSFTQIVLLEGEIKPQVLEVVRISWWGRVLGLPTGLFVDVKAEVIIFCTSQDISS